MTNAYDTQAIARFVAARLREDGSDPPPQAPGTAARAARAARAADACWGTLLEWRAAASVEDAGAGNEAAYADGLAMAVAMIATTWSEHPDYDHAWAPGGHPDCCPRGLAAASGVAVPPARTG